MGAKREAASWQANGLGPAVPDLGSHPDLTGTRDPGQALNLSEHQSSPELGTIGPTVIL